MKLCKQPDMIVKVVVDNKCQIYEFTSPEDCFGFMLDLYNEFPDKEFHFQVFAEVEPDKKCNHKKKKVYKKKKKL